jgi:hypothetical protein
MEQMHGFTCGRFNVIFCLSSSLQLFVLDPFSHTFVASSIAYCSDFKTPNGNGCQ